MAHAPMTHMTCTARQAKAPWRPGPCRIATGATALVLAMALPASALAQVYMGHAADGSLVLSDIRSAATPDLWVPGRAPERPEALSIPLPEASATSRRGVARVPGVPGVPERFIAIIQTAARAHGVPAPLIAAVAAAESAFDPRAASTKGARGLMQLMPDTARRFNVQDRLSPEQSVHGGAAYLRWLSDRKKSDGLFT